MKWFLAMIALFTTTALAAQPSYYESRARQNAEYKSLGKATERAYTVPSSISSNPAYRSSTSGTSNTTGNSGARTSTGTKTAEPLDWPKAAPKKTTAQIVDEHNAWLKKVREEEKLERAAWLEGYKAETARSANQAMAYNTEAKRAEKVKALAIPLEVKGFTATEAFSMAYGQVPLTDGKQPEGEDAQTISVAAAALTRFTDRISTASYEELATLTAMFKTSTITYCNAQQALAARFPDKKDETEIAELLSIPFFWGGTHSMPTHTAATRATESERAQIMDRLFVIAPLHKSEFDFVLTLMNDAALTRLETTMNKAKAGKGY